MIRNLGNGKYKLTYNHLEGRRGPDEIVVTVNRGVASWEALDYRWLNLNHESSQELLIQAIHALNEKGISIYEFRHDFLLHGDSMRSSSNSADAIHRALPHRGVMDGMADYRPANFDLATPADLNAAVSNVLETETYKKIGLIPVASEEIRDGWTWGVRTTYKAADPELRAAREAAMADMGKPTK